jgi:hypothetical protein
MRTIPGLWTTPIKRTVITIYCVTGMAYMGNFMVPPISLATLYGA